MEATTDMHYATLRASADHHDLGSFSQTDATTLATALSAEFSFLPHVRNVRASDGPTCWYIVSVPNKWAQRAADFLAGWRARY